VTPLDMDPGIRARWTAALRSGDYEQGRGALRTDYGFCCLGVLCDLAARDGVVEAVQDESGYWQYDDETGRLPRSVFEWADLDDSNPQVMIHGMYLVELATLNDDLRWDFDAIADVIDGIAPAAAEVTP
jgi:hypothetical protein